MGPLWGRNSSKFEHKEKKDEIRCFQGNSDSSEDSSVEMENR